MSESSVVAILLTILPFAASLGLLRSLRKFASSQWVWLPLAIFAIGIGCFIALPHAQRAGVALAAVGYQLWVIGPFLSLFKRLFGILLPSWPTAGLLQQLGFAMLLLVMLLPPISILWWLK